MLAEAVLLLSCIPTSRELYISSSRMINLDYSGLYIQRLYNQPVYDGIFRLLRVVHPEGLILIHGPAPHILRCRQNVSQCSLPTNIIVYQYSPLLWAMGDECAVTEKPTLSSDEKCPATKLVILQK